MHERKVKKSIDKRILRSLQFRLSVNFFHNKVTRVLVSLFSESQTRLPIQSFLPSTTSNAELARPVYYIRHP
jgi:hypothetical protein